MKNQQASKLFAFKLVDKKQDKQEAQWQVRNNVSTAGCSGPDARAPRPGSRTDNGIWC
ncbi:hypothetical protein KSF73_12260 [Burkholderiaceae bacterium DAT-1]|nr:hypothetical protein [Burkholderiaceae bacterium DAT-1]